MEDAQTGDGFLALDVCQFAQALAKALQQKVVGQAQVIEELVVTILCQGHALLTGSPGVAKTTLVRNLASALGCGYTRVQFTPDLTPYDILGGDVLSFDEQYPERRKMVFQPGPIFTSFLLADEINRASPRTQAALLEAMQERQVSHGGVTRRLPEPFFVFATQNPIEHEGTFPLPEAQLDRFLLNIEVPYPDFEAEVQVATMPGRLADLSPMANAHAISGFANWLNRVELSKLLTEAIVRLVRNTRPESTQLPVAKEMLSFGASPRASQALANAAKAFALLKGDKQVGWEHIQAIAPSVLRHRVVLSFRAQSMRRSASSVVEEIIRSSVL